MNFPVSLEVLNTTAAVVTAAVISASAIAAVFQLRHMRAGNQINALLALRESFEDEKYRRAEDLVGRELHRLMKDPGFCEWVAKRRSVDPALVSKEYTQMFAAANVVGNFWEQCGMLCKNGIIDEVLFLDQYCTATNLMWNRMQSFIALARKVDNDPAVLENFEYLTVRSREWMARYPQGTYPKGVHRIPMNGDSS